MLSEVNTAFLGLSLAFLGVAPTVPGASLEVCPAWAVTRR
jgi:hypothetical protein